VAGPTTTPAHIAARQLARFHAEVYRLAASAEGAGVGGDERDRKLTEKEWCELWRCVVPLWKDAQVCLIDRWIDRYIDK
jgi:hypothetical protein